MILFFILMLIVGELASIYVAVFPFEFALAVPFDVYIITFILSAINPRVGTATMHVFHLPFTFIDTAIGSVIAYKSADFY